MELRFHIYIFEFSGYFYSKTYLKREELHGTSETCIITNGKHPCRKMS